MDQQEIDAGRAELDSAGARLRRVSVLLGPLALVASAAISIPALAFANLLGDGAAVYWINALALGVLSVPAVVVATRVGVRQQQRTAELMEALQQNLTTALGEAEAEAQRRRAETRRQEFESQIANALEMAEGEQEVDELVERAFTAVLPETGAELLLADNSHAHLARVAASEALDRVGGCSVTSPDRCPAARRSQVQRFADSEALDACPKLRDRPGGPCSAVCVPVSMMGRTVGVIHAAGERGVPFPDAEVRDLQTLANLAGARIGLLRMVAETQLQAETDALTGLLNRRSLENRARLLRHDDQRFALVMADLDHFKALNDTHGHETGDRALRVFAEVLRRTVRDGDLVSRHGGEEFVVILPGCGLADAEERLARVQSELAQAMQVAGLPSVTASYGVVRSEPGEDLASCLARADLALFEAKEGGRDRVVAHAAFGGPHDRGRLEVASEPLEG